MSKPTHLLAPYRVQGEEYWVSRWVSNWRLNYSPCTVVPSHHLDKFLPKPRLLLGQGCNMVHSNLSLCQYVKTPSFFFIMLLIVSAKTALHLVDSNGTLSQNLLLWMMKGGCVGSISRCEVHQFLALHSLFSSRICRIKVPFFGEWQDTEEGFLQLFFVINKFKKSCIKSCLNKIKPFCILYLLTLTQKRSHWTCAECNHVLQNVPDVKYTVRCEALKALEHYLSNKFISPLQLLPKHSCPPRPLPTSSLVLFQHKLCQFNFSIASDSQLCKIVVSPHCIYCQGEHVII